MCVRVQVHHAAHKYDHLLKRGGGAGTRKEELAFASHLNEVRRNRVGFLQTERGYEEAFEMPPPPSSPFNLRCIGIGMSWARLQWEWELDKCRWVKYDAMGRDEGGGVEAGRRLKAVDERHKGKTLVTMTHGQKHQQPKQQIDLKLKMTRGATTRADLSAEADKASGGGSTAAAAASAEESKGDGDDDGDDGCVR